MLGWMPWVLKVVTMRSLSQGKSYLIAPSVPLPSQQGLISKCTCQHTHSTGKAFHLRSVRLSITIMDAQKHASWHCHPATNLLQFGKKVTFFFERLFLVVARTWLECRSVCFFWAKNPNFCHTIPILVNGLFIALRETFHFPPWEVYYCV